MNELDTLLVATPELFCDDSRKDGLYRVETSYLCAGFVVEKGAVVRCAPILRNRLAYWLTVALFVCACGGGLSRPDGWTIVWNDGLAPLANVELAVQVAQEHAPCEAGHGAIHGGTVRFYAEPFACGDLLRASGCAWQDGSRSYSILWHSSIEATALWDELGHAVWFACYGRSGEDAAHTYDPDFIAWLDGVRLDFLQRKGV